MAKLAIRLRKLHFRGFRIRDRQRSVGISALQIDRATDLGEPFFGVALGCNNRPKATLPTTDLGEVSTPMRSILTAALRSVCCSRNPLNSSSFHSWVI